jgi:glycosyltransferase involved in cell wall biosynthesis
LRIAVFDYRVTATNPCGSCHLRMLRDLCGEHEFVVFATEFENPCPGRIEFVRVPAPRRPLAVLFVAFHVLAPLYYAWYRLRTRKRFDLVQMVESNLLFGDIAYAHFCHRAYLSEHRQKAAGGGWLVQKLRFLDHWMHAVMEPWVFRRVRRIVTPSQGLARELKRYYPFAADKILVVSNPVDLARMARPADFDRAAFRASQGLAPDDLALVFVALGHFERKGLPQLLSAMTELHEPRLKLLIVGGSEQVQQIYRRKCQELGLSAQVIFAGMQRDVRPYLWAADAFTLPSFYETFSLVAFEAAAAGLPLLVSPLYGVEEFLINGENGFLIEPRTEAIHEGLQRFTAAAPEVRAAVGRRAAMSLDQFDVDVFSNRWKQVYAG